MQVLHPRPPVCSALIGLLGLTVHCVVFINFERPCRLKDGGCILFSCDPAILKKDRDFCDQRSLHLIIILVVLLSTCAELDRSRGVTTIRGRELPLHKSHCLYNSTTAAMEHLKQKTATHSSEKKPEATNKKCIQNDFLQNFKI